MNAKKHKVFVGLAVCALALAALGSARHPVERPLKLKATVVWIVSADGSAVCTQEGEATHVGCFTAVGSAIWDLPNLLIESGGGTVTAANGDILNWVIGENNSVIFTGGTGRFSNASGGFSSEPRSVAFEPGPTEGTTKLTIEYTGTGTITY